MTAATPVQITLGDRVFETLPATAYAGAHGRVHSSEVSAVLDKATNELAERYLGKRYGGEKMLTFNELLDVAMTDVELFRMVADLAEFKVGSDRQ